jgi:predicted molibdopterin-dependent oxidoreductase YjgC
MASMVNITIDGKNFQAEEGRNLMQVAKENGIFIPSLCYYKHIEPPLGSCRVCTCKINGKFGPACTEKITAGLVVEVNNTELKDTRKALVEMMFARPAKKVAIAICNIWVTNWVLVLPGSRTFSKTGSLITNQAGW